MKLKQIKEEFRSGHTDKWQYIDKMYDQHISLFDYAEFIKDTNISAITISDDSVIMTFRDSGVKMKCVANDKRLAPFDALNFNNYEQDELEMQLNLINKNAVILDIGGNFGWYCLHVANKHKSSTIYSFEPIPQTYKALKENIALNNAENIIPYNFGLSDNNGIFDFYFDPQLSVNASLANVSDNPDTLKVQCTVKKLDDWSTQLSSIDFIKCDVEGAELLAFKGGEATLKKFKPVVFSEMLRKWTARFNYHPNDIISFFINLGYKCYTTENGSLKEFSTVDENTVETNYFFLHSEKHAALIKKFVN